MQGFAHIAQNAAEFNSIGLIRYNWRLRSGILLKLHAKPKRKTISSVKLSRAFGV
jgi:hypothetical protein